MARAELSEVPERDVSTEFQSKKLYGLSESERKLVRLSGLFPFFRFQPLFFSAYGLLSDLRPALIHVDIYNILTTLCVCIDSLK